MSGADFAAGAGIGAANLSLKGMKVKTGAEIAAIGSPVLGDRIMCSVTGSGYTAGVVYTRDDTNTVWIASSGMIHEILRTQAKDLFYVNETFPKYEFWNRFNTGGTLANDDNNGGWSFATGTSTDNRATLSKKASSRFDFGKNGMMLCKVNLSTSLRVLFRAGMGMDPSNVFTGTRRMWGIEIDNNTDVAKNLYARTANGTTGSAEDTGVSTFTGADKLVRMEYLAGVSLKVYIGGSLVYTKTTNIPTSGDTGSGGETVIFVIQTRSTAGKTLIMMSCQCAGKEAQVY